MCFGCSCWRNHFRYNTFVKWSWCFVWVITSIWIQLWLNQDLHCYTCIFLLANRCGLYVWNNINVQHLKRKNRYGEIPRSIGDVSITPVYFPPFWRALSRDDVLANRLLESSLHGHDHFFIADFQNSHLQQTENAWWLLQLFIQSRYNILSPKIMKSNAKNINKCINHQFNVYGRIRNWGCVVTGSDGCVIKHETQQNVPKIRFHKLDVFKYRKET